MNAKQRAEVNREDWLLRATDALKRGLLKDEKLPDRVYVSVGFPRGSKGKRRAIGQCWPKSASADKNGHIFISPELTDPVQILGVLIHEIGHDVVGCEHGHKKPFADFCKRVGLVKPWTATVPNDDLVVLLKKLSDTLGTYPHAALSVSSMKKQTTRMRLYQCQMCEQKVRAASDSLNIQCNECDEQYILIVKGDK